jgi:hypothetical protein
MSEPTNYGKNVGSFFEAASNANCVPKNLAEFLERLLEILNKIEKKSDDKLSSEEMLIELYCRNPWSYWGGWTSSSSEKSPHQTYPIENFLAKLEELVKVIEKNNAQLV